MDAPWIWILDAVLLAVVGSLGVRSVAQSIKPQAPPSFEANLSGFIASFPPPPRPAPPAMGCLATVVGGLGGGLVHLLGRPMTDFGFIQSIDMLFLLAFLSMVTGVLVGLLNGVTAALVSGLLSLTPVDRPPTHVVLSGSILEIDGKRAILNGPPTLVLDAMRGALQIDDVLLHGHPDRLTWLMKELQRRLVDGGNAEDVPPTLRAIARQQADAMTRGT